MIVERVLAVLGVVVAVPNRWVGCARDHPFRCFTSCRVSNSCANFVTGYCGHLDRIDADRRNYRVNLKQLFCTRRTNAVPRSAPFFIMFPTVLSEVQQYISCTVDRCYCITTERNGCTPNLPQALATALQGRQNPALRHSRHYLQILAPPTIFTRPSAGVGHAPLLWEHLSRSLECGSRRPENGVRFGSWWQESSRTTKQIRARFASVKPASKAGLWLFLWR